MEAEIVDTGEESQISQYLQLVIVSPFIEVGGRHEVIVNNSLIIYICILNKAREGGRSPSRDGQSGPRQFLPLSQEIDFATIWPSRLDSNGASM